jgi:hypothetical protein
VKRSQVLRSRAVNVGSGRDHSQHARERARRDMRIERPLVKTLALCRKLADPSPEVDEFRGGLASTRNMPADPFADLR